MPRNVHHYFSLFGSAGMGKSTFRRGEIVPVYEIDFGVVLSPGETLASAMWYCSQPYSVIMSNATIAARSTSVTLNCQIQAGSLLKVVATTSSGAHHSYQAEVLVRSGWWFQGDTTVLSTGPYTLYAESGLSITGHLPYSAVAQVVNYPYVVTGNFGPNIVTLIGGALPDGLAISPSGVVTGTLAANGTFNWLLRVTDSRGLSATHPDSVVISTAPTITGDLGDGSVGQVISYQYVAVGAYHPLVVSITAGALPAGLSMDTTGLVTGTLTGGGTFAWTVGVVDAIGQHASLADTAKVSVIAWWLTSVDTFDYPLADQKVWISSDPRVWPNAPVDRSPFVISPTFGAKIMGSYALVIGGGAAVERTTTLDGSSGITTASVTIGAGIQRLWHGVGCDAASVYDSTNWYTSVDNGVTWQTQTDADGLRVHSVMQMTSGRWICYHEAGPSFEFAYSDQAVPTTWQSADAGGAQIYASFDIAVGDGFAAASTASVGGSLVTTDGATWTAFAGTPVLLSVRDAASNGSTVIFVGESTDIATHGGICRSSNSGQTFGTVTAPKQVYDRVAYANGYWVASSNAGDVAAVSVDDGVTWAASALPSHGTIPNVALIEYVP